ncbi:unnamed protein product [Bursaphelenchus xylophilus]|uniref:(pine wood nematode) hypothetical protein n=1 Tax=Bursaphelenchus xylophilus TaxID=6326 RepID=A0A811L263_BURXY|nr:unnamed protein product [Bursaphelenchus xylophilus]CAG9108846.1 unnamed protein product [Bursaphelenchus xylophilus]
MSGWRNQLNSVGNNAFDFVQRISSELAAETPIDPSSELDYHKQKALEKEKELVRYQNQLVDKNRQIEELTENVRAAYEEVEMTRQSLLNRIAAKELELEKAKYEIEALRDFQTSTDPEQERNEKELILELELIKAEKAALSDELSFLAKRLEESESNQRKAVVEESQPKQEDFKYQSVLDDLKKAEARIEDLQNQNRALAEELAMRPRSTSPVTRESRVNVAELEEIENQVDLLRQERDQFKVQFEKSEVKAKEMEGLMTALSEQCQILGAEVESYMKKAPEITNVFQVPVVSKELDELREELNDLEAERQKATIELEEIRKTFKEKEASFATRIQELESTLAETSDVVTPSYLTNKVEQLLRDLEEVKVEKKSIEDRYQSTQEVLSKNENLYQDVSNLCKLLSEDSSVNLQNLIEKQKLGYSELKMRLKNTEDLMNQQKFNFESTTGDLEQQIDQANLAFLETRKKLADAESLIQKLENEKLELQNRAVEVKNNDNQNDELSQQRMQQLEELVRLKENEHIAEKEKLDLLESKTLETFMLVRDLSEGLREEYGIVVDEKANDDINYKIRNLVFSLKGLVASVNERLKDYERRIQEVTAVKNEVQQRLDQSANQLLHLHEENQYLRSQFNIAQDSVEELTAEKSSLTSELSAVKEELKLLRSESKNLAENTAEAELYKLHAASKIEKKQAELEEQSALLEKKQQDLEQNRMVMDRWTRENESLRKTVAGLNETIRDLQSAYVETDGKLKVERMEYENRIRELEGKLARNEFENGKWSNKVVELEEQNKQLESTVNELKMELEEYEKGASVPPPPPEPTIEIKQQYKMIESGFVVPPVVRQFIISAVTCDANKREESAILLANIIGCTQEEKSQIEECFQHRGVWGLLRGTPKGPQNIKELSSKFIEFLEKETTQPMGASNVENTEPIRIAHDIQPVASSSNADLKEIMNDKS